MIENVTYRIVKRSLFLIFKKDTAITLEESVSSLFPFLAKEHCLTRRGFLSNERKAVYGHKINSFKSITVVGGGAVPFTAIYWAKFFPGPITVLDKDKTAFALGKRLVKKLGIENISFIRQWGETYSEYENSIVAISLYAENKDAILRKVLESKSTRALVLLRVFKNE
ncbi:MAG: hypothetical protein JRF69_13775, partial [Deltaproteobacteria bacterium]|nr:hypothetical protein [Deltaproteobacteria bacterium]